MKVNTDHIEALSRLSWLAVFRLTLNLFNSIREQWNNHPYFGGIKKLPKFGDKNVEALFTTAVSNSVGLGGQPVSQEKIETEVKEFLEKNSFGAQFKPEFNMPNEPCLQDISESIFGFAALHRDIIAALMIVMLQKLSLEHTDKPVKPEELDESFVAEAFKKVGLTKLSPLLILWQDGMTGIIARSLGSQYKDLNKHVGQFVFLAITDYAKKRLV